jgi:hypothetical protein
MSSHALTIARAFCCANGHRQDYGVLLAERYRNFPFGADPEDGRQTSAVAGRPRSSRAPLEQRAAPPRQRPARQMQEMLG